MNNLLSNAIKFTPENGDGKGQGPHHHRTRRQLHLSRRESGRHGHRHCSGRTEKTSSEVLSNQTRIQYQQQGWGIGLSLVQRLVTIHKGTIELKSELQHGSTFRILLNVDAKAFDRQSSSPTTKSLYC
ncbi:MAG: ATP-binding protein [Hoylesella buccalis]